MEACGPFEPVLPTERGANIKTEPNDPETRSAKPLNCTMHHESTNSNIFPRESRDLAHFYNRPMNTPDQPNHAVFAVCRAPSGGMLLLPDSMEHCYSVWRSGYVELRAEMISSALWRPNLGLRALWVCCPPNEARTSKTGQNGLETR